MRSGDSREALRGLGKTSHLFIFYCPCKFDLRQSLQSTCSKHKVKMSEVQSYVSAKYVAANLLTKDGASTTPEGEYDPWIYPATGHIPFCTQCQSDFDSFKKQPLNKASITADMEHSNACLWYDYFCKKMRLMAPNVVIRRTVKSAAPVPVKK